VSECHTCRDFLLAPCCPDLTTLSPPPPSLSSLSLPLPSLSLPLSLSLPFPSLSLPLSSLAASPPQDDFEPTAEKI